MTRCASRAWPRRSAPRRRWSWRAGDGRDSMTRSGGGWTVSLRNGRRCPSAIARAHQGDFGFQPPQRFRDALPASLRVRPPRLPCLVTSATRTWSSGPASGIHTPTLTISSSGLMCEAATGARYEELLQRLVAQPLDLTHTPACPARLHVAWAVPARLRRHRRRAHARRRGVELGVPGPHRPTWCVSPLAIGISCTRGGRRAAHLPSGRFRAAGSRHQCGRSRYLPLRHPLRPSLRAHRQHPGLHPVRPGHPRRASRRRRERDRADHDEQLRGIYELAVGAALAR